MAELKIEPPTLDFSEGGMLLTTLPSTLLSQVENSVVLKIDLLPASRENLPSYSFYARFDNIWINIDLY